MALSRNDFYSALTGLRGLYVSPRGVALRYAARLPLATVCRALGARAVTEKTQLNKLYCSST